MHINTRSGMSLSAGFFFLFKADVSLKHTPALHPRKLYPDLQSVHSVLLFITAYHLYLLSNLLKLIVVLLV